MRSRAVTAAAAEQLRVVGGPMAFNHQLKTSASLHELETAILSAREEDFNVHTCTTAIWLLGTKRSQNRRVITTVLDLSQRHTLDSRGLATCCHGIAIGRLLPQLPQFLLSPLNDRTKLHEFNSLALTNIVWSFAKLNQPLPAELAADIANRRNWGDFSPQSLGSVFYSLALLGGGRGSLDRGLASLQARPSLQEFPAQTLSTILRAVAKTQSSRTGDDCTTAVEVVVRRLGEELLQRPLRAMFAEDVTNTVWALASLAESSLSSSAVVVRGLFAGFVSRIKFMDRSQFKPQELATLMWALATVQPDKSNDDNHQAARVEMLSLLHDDFLFKRRIYTLSPQHVATVAWAFAKLDYPCTRLCEHFARQAWRCGAEKEEKDPWRAQDYANLMWALAKTDVPIPMWLMVKLLEDDGGGAPSSFSDKALSNILWALARSSSSSSPHGGGGGSGGLKRQHTVNELAARFCGELERRWHRSSGSSISGGMMASSKWIACVGALCALGKRPPAGMLDRELEWHKLSLRELATLTAGLAHVNHRNERVLEQIARRATSLLEEDGGSRHDHGQDPFLLMWAFACLDALRLDAVHDFFQQPWRGGGGGDHRTVQSAHQLMQTRLAWRAAYGPSTSSSSCAPLLDSMGGGDRGWDEALVRHRLTERVPSLSQLAVFRMLGAHFDQFLSSTSQLVNETSVCDGLLSVDMVIESMKAVVEVDGPTHFLSDGTTLNGASRMKRRLLESAGYEVFSIPVVQFQRLNETEQLAYVKALARTIVHRRIERGGGGRMSV